MREFNYQRAWREWAQPRFDKLSPELRALFTDVLAATDDLHTVPQKYETPFPDTEKGNALAVAFSKFGSEELAEAACVIYYYGHWGYTAEGKESQKGGAYWLFQRLADHVTIKRGETNGGGVLCSKNWEKRNWQTDDFMDHKEGTSLDNDELAAKYRALVPEPFVVQQVTQVNYKPHPYVIGPKHIEAAQSYGGILGKEVMEKVGCAYYDRGSSCGLPYSAHTHDTAIFLTMTRDVANKEAADILSALKPEFEKDNISGVALPPCEFKIYPPDVTTRE